MGKNYFIIIGVAFGLVLFAHANRSHGESSQALFKKGVDEIKTGDPQKAVDFFTQLIMAEPGNSKSHKNRGVAFLKMGEFDLAVRDFEKALELNPDLPGLYSNLGSALHHKQEYKKAIACYDREISKNPHAHISYFNRALSRMELDQKDLAMADLNRCLDLQHDFPEALTLKKRIDDTTAINHSLVPEAFTLKKITNNTAPPGLKNKFELQTGAFLEIKNALDMEKMVREKGEDPHIIPMKDNRKRTWYLVRLKGFADEKEARLFCKNFIEQKKIMAMVRPAGKL